LLEHAKRQDEVMFVQGQAVKALTDESGELCGVQARRHDGETVDIYGQLVIDASGAATFLSNVGIAGKKDRGKYDRQLAIYSHVKGAIRDEEDNTLIFYEDRNHWGWFIPIDQERVSIGVVTPSSYYKESGESMRDFFLREMHKINPELSRRVPDVTLVEEVRATSNYSYQIHEFTGKRFVCIGDAHRFVDPIFSFGLHFAVTEARLVADHIADYLLRGKNRDKENPFVEFARYAELGMDSIEDLVDCFWENPISFAFFVHTRYRNDFIDLFAGRVYQDPPSPGLQAIRKVNAKGRAKQSQMADATPAPVA
jgi:flavin-dependent dehydrogenase